MAKTTVHFVIGTARVELVLDRASLPQPAHPAGYVSFTGTISDGGSGQIVDDLASRTEDVRVRAICAAWRTYHLKDNAPALDAIEAMLRSLDELRLDPPAVDEFEECSFSNSDDVIDSRDVISRIEYLRAYVEEHPIATDARDELAVLEALEDDASGYAADWRYGESLIRDSYFEDFAQQMAEDIGAINREATWPNQHIDWAAAAEALKQDYTSVEFGDVTYWIR